MDRIHGVASTVNSTMAAANENSVLVPPFLSKTYDMVDDPSTNSVVSWSDKNNSFVVWNVPDFAKNILPKYFKHSNFSSFVRQLNTYGFRKVDPDHFEFANEGFLRGQKQLLKSISRRKPAHVGSNHQPSQVHSSPVGACVEVGKFGLEEEVERLKRDKNVLMQELVRLRQQQQTTNNQLQTVGQCVQVMELRQQQTMSFLAKAMQNPGFLTQFVKQQNETNRHITGGNKKRRLSGNEEDSLATEHLHQALDGCVVKYQPSMNEAAKALLGQILQMNTSARMESLMKIPDSFAVDDVFSTVSLDSSSSSQVSEVILSEVPPTSGQSYMVEESKLPVSSIHENQSSQAAMTTCVKVAEPPPECSLYNCQENAFSFDKFQGGKEKDISLVDPDLSFVGPDSENAGEIDMMSNGAQSLEGDAFSPNSDGISKLPGINDVFWEHFLTASPLTGDTDEINSSTFGESFSKELELASEKVDGQEKIEKMLHIDHLTQQMGLLAPESS